MTQRLRLSSVPFAVGQFLGLVLLIRPAVAQERALDPEVEKLLRQRLVVLEEAAKLTQEAYRAGQAEFAGTLAAQQSVLEAKLELAKGVTERLQVREEMLKNAVSLEQTAEQLVKAAEAPRMNLLTAQANRMRAEADLLLERKAAGR